jgi:hypothetical protein
MHRNRRRAPAGLTTVSQHSPGSARDAGRLRRVVAADGNRPQVWTSNRNTRCCRGFRTIVTGDARLWHRHHPHSAGTRSGLEPRRAGTPRSLRRLSRRGRDDNVAIAPGVDTPLNARRIDVGTAHNDRLPDLGSAVRRPGVGQHVPGRERVGRIESHLTDLRDKRLSADPRNDRVVGPDGGDSVDAAAEGRTDH